MIMKTASVGTKYLASAAVVTPAAPVSTLLDWLRMLGIFLALLLALSILTLVTCRYKLEYLCTLEYLNYVNDQAPIT